MKVKVLVTQSCLTLCESMDCSLPGSSVHGILQARLLEWVAILFSRGSSWPKDWMRVSRIAGRFFSVWATKPKPGLPFSPFCNTVFVWGHLWEWNGIQLLFLVGWQLQIRAFVCRLGHRFTLTISPFGGEHSVIETVRADSGVLSPRLETLGLIRFSFYSKEAVSFECVHWCHTVWSGLYPHFPLFVFIWVSVCLFKRCLLSIYHGLGFLMGRGRMKMKRLGPCPQGMYNLVWKQKPAMNRDLKVEEERCMDSLGPWLEESVWADKGSPWRRGTWWGFLWRKIGRGKDQRGRMNIKL